MLFRRRFRRLVERRASVDRRTSLVDRLEPRVLLAGDVDTSFGMQVTTDFNLRGDVALGAAQQADGKLVVVGYSRGQSTTDRDIAVARYNDNGTLDTTFGVDQTVGPFDMKKLPGGGRITLSHNDPTEVNTGEIAHRVAIQPGDGKIVISASMDGMITLIRLMPGGQLDPDFDGDGVAEMHDYSRAPSTQEPLGQDLFEEKTALALVTQNGAVTGYVLSGTRTLPNMTDRSKRADQDWVLAKYTTAGLLDTTFGDDDSGRVVSDFAGADGFPGEDVSWDETYSVEVLGDGKILQSGGSQINRGGSAFDDQDAVSFIRLNPDGTRDTTFGGKRYAKGENGSIAESDGVAGRTIIDFLHDPGNLPTSANLLGMDIDPQGRILATGHEHYRVDQASSDKDATRLLAFRLNPDGRLDTTFAGDGIYDGLPVGGRHNALDDPRAILQRSDGKVLIVGSTGEGTRVGKPGNLLMLQLNPDGSPDTAFGPNGAKAISSAQAIGRFGWVLEQADGKIVAVGQSGRGLDPVTNDFVVARFDAAGNIDGGFGGDNAVLPDMTVRATTVLDDGRILVAGYRGNVETASSKASLARYTADGAPDLSFGPDAEGDVTDAFKAADSVAHSVAAGPGGSAFVAGSAGGKVAVAKFTAAGLPDTSFDADGIATFDFGAAGNDVAYGLAVFGDGSVIVAGASDGDWLLLKLTPGGAPDGTFSGDGAVLVNQGSGEDAAVTPLIVGDKVLVSGTTRDGADRPILLSRFNSDGSVDPTFNGGDPLVTGWTTDRTGVTGDPFNRADARSVAVDAAGRILVSGATGNDAGLARYDAAGAPDAQFGPGGRRTYDWGGVDDPDAVVVGPTGQLFLTGTLNTSGGGSAVVAALTPDGNERTELAPHGVIVLDAPADAADRSFRLLAQRAYALAQRQGNNLIVGVNEELNTGDGRHTVVRRVRAADASAPVALPSLAPPPVIRTAGATSQSFSITYSDDLAVDVATLGVDDVTVTGPGGPLTVTGAVPQEAGNGTPRTVVYTVAAPGGAFDAGENGTYVISVNAGAVRDTSGNGIAAVAQFETFDVNIRPVDPPPGPDLATTPVRAVGGNLLTGSRGRAAARVTNVGDEDAPVPVSVGLYLSSDAQVDSTDTPLATAPARKPLRAGKGVTAKFNRFTYPDVAPGTYHVLALADPDGALTELGYDNNTADLGTVTLAPAFVDAVPVSTVIPVGSLGRGTATLLVRNDGNVALRGTISGSLVQVLIEGTSLTADYTAKVSIKAGATKRVKVRFTAPAGMTGPFAYFTAVAPNDPTPGQQGQVTG